MSDDEKEIKEVHHSKTWADVQRIKLEKLMANPDKPVHIPERPQDKNVNKAPEFNHNIMGSSAGAGSGEFHLYRQMRRKEAIRTKILGSRKARDELNEAYHLKLEENQRLAEEKTAKKRKKRQKRKGKKKGGNKEEKKVEEEGSKEGEEEIEKLKNNSSIETVEKSQDSDIKKSEEKKKPLIIYYN